MAPSLMDLPPLPELLRLGQADLYRLAGAPPRAASGFGPGSAPYLWASEFPAAVLAGLGLRPPVLCVAGSGDNAVELLRLGLWPIVAADVSRAACYVGELKAAALASGLTRDDYLGLLPAPPPALLTRLAPKLSAEALAFWRRVAERGGVEPASLLEREPHLAGLPYLATEEAYGQTLEAARPWPLLNLSLEDFLGRSSEPFGTIYVSNVGEYIRRELLLGGREDEVEGRLAEFYQLVASRLLRGGVALAYLFEAEGRAAAGAEAAAMAAAGLGVDPHPIEFRRLGTLFRHCLLAGRSR
jgi:hypothetical protein